jgi:hypothetical protein
MTRYRRKTMLFSALPAAVLFLTACGFFSGFALAAEPTLPPPATATQAPPAASPTPAPTATPGLNCTAAFEKRELKAPYQHQEGNQPRYTLSAEELSSYLQVMGVSALCIPQEFGAPFLNVDWDSAVVPSARGRMISLGFENLYPGAGWSEIYLLYSTYDFSFGSEYDRFASLKDLQAVQDGSMANLFEVDGVKGFLRYKAGISYGSVPLYKTYVFPFENYYVALVEVLGYAGDDWEAALARLQAGEVPADKQASEALFDRILETLKFTR